MLTRDPQKVQIGNFPVVSNGSDWYVDGGEKGIIEIYTSKEELEKALNNTEEILVLG